MGKANNIRRQIAEHWEHSDDMLKNCRQLTAYLQEDYGAMNGIQPPWFAAFDMSLKCLVFTSENHFHLLYFMYKA